VEELSLRDVVINPIQHIYFQMNPSRVACGASLQSLGKDAVVMKVLAAGNLQADQAVQSLEILKNLYRGAVDVSSARTTKISPVS
jgi:hypothetical protein